MKRLLPLLLLLTILLCACSDATPAGTWSATVDCAALCERLGDMPETLDLSGLTLRVDLTCAENGTYLLRVNEASLEDLLKSLREPLAKAALKTVMDTYGLTEDEARARLSERGTTAEQLADSFLAAVDREAILRPTGGKWRWTEGKLYLSDQTNGYYDAVLDGDELRLTACRGIDAAQLAELLPLTFRR